MKPQHLVLVVLATAIAGCERSESYFAEHPDVAKQVVDDCKQGAHRGPECQNALAAEAEARHEAVQAVWRSMQQPTTRGSDKPQGR